MLNFIKRQISFEFFVHSHLNQWKNAIIPTSSELLLYFNASLFHQKSLKFYIIKIKYLNSDKNLSLMSDSDIPSRLQETHKNFILISDSCYYKTYKGQLKSTGETHNIRVLNTESAQFQKDPDRATTLFLQEIFYLCTRLSKDDLVYPEYLSVQGQRITIVTKEYKFLEKKRDAAISSVSPSKLIRDVEKDIDFLYKKAGLSNYHINPEKVCKFSGYDVYFLSEWMDSADSNDMMVQEQSIIHKKMNELIRLCQHYFDEITNKLRNEIVRSLSVSEDEQKVRRVSKEMFNSIPTPIISVESLILLSSLENRVKIGLVDNEVEYDQYLRFRQ